MQTATYHSYILESLVSLGERRGLKEQEAAELIKSLLNTNQVPYFIQAFETVIPIVTKAELYADGEPIPCVGASFSSGQINNATIMHSFETPVKSPMICFNPLATGISMTSYKEFPAVSVNRDSIAKIALAKSVSGEVSVEPFTFMSQNILVGNVTKPKAIIFAHYDSIIGSGAVDNAAAVEVLITLILEKRHVLEDYLFVFAGSEEETISRHDGFHGFENFDTVYNQLIDATEKIIVIDGLGVSEPYVTQNLTDYVFGITRYKAIMQKLYWLANDQTIVMQTYHSTNDTLTEIKPHFIVAAMAMVQKLIE